MNSLYIPETSQQNNISPAKGIATMSKPTICNVPELEALVLSSSVAKPQIKLGDAIKAIGQRLQGFELQLTRDKTPTDAANFDSL